MGLGNSKKYIRKRLGRGRILIIRRNRNRRPVKGKKSNKKRRRVLRIKKKHGRNYKKDDLSYCPMCGEKAYYYDFTDGHMRCANCGY